MLRKLAEWYERICGRSASLRCIPIPKGFPVIRLPHDRADEYYRLLAECVQQLGSCYTVEEHRAPAVSLRSFAPRGNPQNLSVLHAYRLGGKDGKECNWVTLTFREVFRDGRRLAEDDAIRQAVIARLEFDAGSVLIGPESIRDKVAELFGPIDIDFRHETTFSRKYFVLADDEQRLRKHLPPSFMAMLSEESGVFARIRKHELLLARDRSIRVEDALQLARLGFAAMECR